MTPADDHILADGAAAGSGESFVTAMLADQLFGIPIGRVHDVFNLGHLTPVPLAPSDVVGLMNLRGRVVTAVDIRQRLGFAQGPIQAGAMAVGIEIAGESFGLVVDRIGEIVTLGRDAREDNPIHLDPSWAELSCGVHQLETGLLVVLDVDAMLDIAPGPSDLPRT